jgi:hypothetical protein
MIISEMGFNIKNNYGPNIEVNEGGMLNLYQSQNGRWNTPKADDAEIVEEDILISQLKPMFFGAEEEVRSFLLEIKGMKPKQITARVNQLVRENKLSEISCHRDLWQVLHNCGIYTPTESNWNQQIR